MTFKIREQKAKESEEGKNGVCTSWPFREVSAVVYMFVGSLLATHFFVVKQC